MSMVKQYNALGKGYVKKCEYFKDIGNDAIKFYSRKKNEEKHKKVLGIEEQLEKQLDRILSAKNQIRIMMIELSVKLSEYYENIRIRIEEYRKII